MRVDDFYSSSKYIEGQRRNTKAAWKRGLFKSLSKKLKRKCARENCDVEFSVTPSDPRKYCSHGCSAQVSNLNRGSLSAETRKKIGQSLLGVASPFKGVVKVPRVQVVCGNSLCGKKFLIERWKPTKFCSNACAMKITGGRPTSPKAARGKAGVRKDISDSIYFYSRWEANMVRLFNFFNIKWVYQPRTFDLRGQNYTPDFFLPEYGIYVEVKNFLGEYSQIRDEKFRKIYPNLRLELLLKNEYLELETAFSEVIPNWEYKNSPF